MWEQEPLRFALLELWACRLLRRRKENAPAWDHLDTLPWTRRTTHRDELALVPEHRDRLEQLLDGSWPAWRRTTSALDAVGLPLSLRGWRRLKEIQRLATLPKDLPARINQRTAAATLAEHSKLGLSREHLAALGSVTVTRDGLVRLRPHAGATVVKGPDVFDASLIANVFGEVAITERAILDGTRLGGPKPTAVLLIENVGAYVDVPGQPDWLIAHVPGWNTATVKLLLEQLPGVTTLHFGDLDPNGLRILEHLRELRPDLRWIVPDFWREYVETRGQRGLWPEDIDLAAAPPLVRDLARQGLWLEQEVIALDPRLPASLMVEATISKA